MLESRYRAYNRRKGEEAEAPRSLALLTSASNPEVEHNRYTGHS